MNNRFYINPKEDYRTDHILTEEEWNSPDHQEWVQEYGAGNWILVEEVKSGLEPEKKDET